MTSGDAATLLIKKIQRVTATSLSELTTEVSASISGTKIFIALAQKQGDKSCFTLLPGEHSFLLLSSSEAEDCLSCTYKPPPPHPRLTRGRSSPPHPDNQPLLCR